MTTQPTQPNMNQQYVFHPQQKDAGDRILHHFTSGEVYGILLAQMQSGKSGAYLYAALKAIHHSEYRVERVFIISGNRDTSLRFQTQQNVKKAAIRYCDDNAIGVADFIDILDRITVHFGQDLERCPPVPENSMIIVDESHYAQSKDNVPYVKFWQRNGIEKCLSGNMSVLIEKNIRVLSVSATPFSEIIQNQKVHLGIESTVDLCLKNLIYMEPGERYYGIKDYMDDRKFFFYPREMCWSNWLRRRTIEPKYYIVRTQCMEKAKPEVEEKCRRMGLYYKPIGSGEGKEAFEFLKRIPELATVVHLCGKGRMGQEMDRTHVAMVWEASKNPKADTILQALPGRMCGYGDNTDITICVPETCRSKIEQYHNAITTGEFQEKLSTVGPAMNVSKSRDEHTHTCGNYVKDASDGIWKKRVPIRFRYTGHITHNIQEIENNLRGIINDDVLGEIIDCIMESRVIYRNLSENIYQHRNLEEHLLRACVENKPYTDNFTNGISEYPTGQTRRFQVLSNPRGEYSYIIGYDLCEPTEMNLERFKQMQCVSKVHKKCVYNPAEFTTESGTTVIANGGQLITFPQETEKDPSLFRIKLEEAIRRTIPTDPMYIEDACPRITSNYCGTSSSWKGVRLDFEELIIKRIKQEMEVRLRVKITMKKIQYRLQGYNGIRYSEISWKGR